MYKIHFKKRIRQDFRKYVIIVFKIYSQKRYSQYDQKET